MTDMSNSKASLGRAIHAITGKWGWFVALGVGELILGGIASANLMAASLASVLVIGATRDAVLNDRARMDRLSRMNVGRFKYARCSAVSKSEGA